jgi:hypothetical protein
MSETTFGASAARLCGAASLLLSWRPDEFWNSTPADLALALQPVADGAQPPEPERIEQLRRRFPDE